MKPVPQSQCTVDNMNQPFYFASVFAILLSNVAFKMAQDLSIKIGLRRFDVFSRSVNFDEARVGCENRGWHLAHVRNRTIALKLQDVFLNVPSKTN